MSVRPASVATVGVIAMIVLVFVPWGRLSIEVLGFPVQNVARATIGAVAALLFTLLNLATLGSGTPHIAVNGADSLLKPDVAAAWGSYAEVVTAVLVLLAVLALRRESPSGRAETA